jgi:hypothetical protein
MTLLVLPDHGCAYNLSWMPAASPLLKIFLEPAKKKAPPERGQEAVRQPENDPVLLGTVCVDAAADDQNHHDE